LQKECAIPAEHVETMVMKAMALGLIRGSIDQLVGGRMLQFLGLAPKVLEMREVGYVKRKFEEWDEGLRRFTQW